jgi:hypothetical protein
MKGVSNVNTSESIERKLTLKEFFRILAEDTILPAELDEKVINRVNVCLGINNVPNKPPP